MTKIKSTKQLERHFKGVSNHYRIAILLIVAQYDSLTLEEISGKLNTNFKNVSQHTLRLVQSGLLNKNYKGRMVEHSLSPYGKIFVKFIESFMKTNNNN
jgi:predicted transcriptional regulator